MFDDVANLNWSFDLPDYEISISLASGDSSSRESTAQEGLYTTIIGSTLQLRFFDNSGSYISHNDESALPLRTSVRFIEFSNSVEYIKDNVSLGIGTFESIPVPEPATYGLIVGILAFGAGIRRSSGKLRCRVF